MSFGLNIVTLFIVIPHAALAIATRRARPFLVSAVIAVAVAAPQLVLASRAASQLNWLPDPTVTELYFGLRGLFGSGPMTPLILAAAAAAVVQLWWTRRLRSLAPHVLFLFAPVAVWIVSQVANVYLGRYFLWSIAFFTIVIAVGLRRFWLSAAVLVLVAVLAVPAQIDQRRTDGHGDDYRSAVAFIDANARPGDAIDMQSWLSRAAWAYYHRGGVAVVADPTATNRNPTHETLDQGGTRCDDTTFASVDRVWFLRLRDTAAASSLTPAQCDPTLREVGNRIFNGAAVTLYARP
jgi:mannosyltransferase